MGAQVKWMFSVNKTPTELYQSSSISKTVAERTMVQLWVESPIYEERTEKEIIFYRNKRVNNFNFSLHFSKRGFMVIDFDYPNKPKKYLCNFKWEPGSLEWNPHHANDDLFASVVSGYNFTKIIGNYRPLFVNVNQNWR